VFLTPDARCILNGLQLLNTLSADAEQQAVAVIEATADEFNSSIIIL